MAIPAAGIRPRLLKEAYLAPQESLLRETRATKLYYFPGPVLVLAILSTLDYGAASALAPGVYPALPYLTSWLGRFGTSAGAGALSILFDLLLLLSALSLLLLLVRWLRWITTVYAVTSSRVVIQRGILSRDFDEIPVDQIRGIDVHQTIGQRMLGFGTIRITAEGGRTLVGNEEWYGIPKPFQFQRLVEGATQLFRSGPVASPAAMAPGAAPYYRPPGTV